MSGVSGLLALRHKKSQYGRQFYVNQGFWLKDVDDVPFPESAAAHVAGRVEDLVPSLEDRLSELLDLDTDVSAFDRRTELGALLTTHVLPLIERGDSIGGLRQMHADGVLAGFGLTAEALEALG